VLRGELPEGLAQALERGLERRWGHRGGRLTGHERPGVRPAECDEDRPGLLNPSGMKSAASPRS
jgi:hypothetical protein